MSFALAFQDITNKSRDKKTWSPAKGSSHPHHSINHLNRNSPDHIFELQRAIGNQAVQKLMHPKGDGFDLARICIQPKLRVSQPEDAYEQEADRIAEQVTRLSNDNSSPAKSSSISKDTERIDRKCSACEIEGEEEKERGMFSISGKAKSTAGIEASDKSINEISSAIHSSSGSPLDANTKEFVESRFGYDFGKIRIHTDTVAGKSAHSVNALAYTVGNDIVFAEGKYQTSTESGRRLLAHELAHTVQQISNPSSNLIARQAGPNQGEQTVQMCVAPPDPNGEWASEDWLYQMRREPKGSNRILLALGRRGPARGRSVELLHQALLAWQCQYPEDSKHGITISEYQSGEYREGTKEVVRDFQKWAGVATDGIVGPYTIEALDYKVVGGPPHVSEVHYEAESPESEKPIVQGDTFETDSDISLRSRLFEYELQNITSFSLLDPLSSLFGSLVITNMTESSHISIPEDWLRVVNEFCRDNTADRDLLLGGLARLPTFSSGGSILDIQPNAIAITLDRAVFVRGRLPLSTFVHELVHVFQYGYTGRTGFLVSYFGASGATIAYRFIKGLPLDVMKSSPHEEQAYNLETRFKNWYHSKYGSSADYVFP